jgi:hypothetical protein
MKPDFHYVLGYESLVSAHCSDNDGLQETMRTVDFMWILIISHLMRSLGIDAQTANIFGAEA